ncbi:MAG: penicillin-binding protein 2 [Kiritimatiellia bacterium]|jgi:penicillin-binding protein 2
MSAASLTKHEAQRLLWLWAAMFLGLLLLLSALGRMQLGLGRQYEVSLERQSIRRVRIPGVRGRIFDRTGACLADNRPSYGIAVYVEELRQPGRLDNTVKAVRRLLDQVGEKIGKPTPVSDRQIEEHLHSRRALPLTAWRNLSLIEMARLAEAGIGLHAADIVVDAERVYPQSETAGHLLGYVGKREYTTGEEPYHYYLPDLTGRAGLERRFDTLLAGRPGGQLVRVDVSGFRYAEISARQPIPGDDLILSLDLTAQRAAEHALQGAVGAAVVLDPSNGDVLALASSPAIDPNWFCPILPQKVWSGLLADTDKPLLNRAVAGVYPPGSIFKPVVALAALEHGAISRGYTVNCRGVLPLGRRTFACYHGHAHGTIGLRRALEISCNVYFYLAGLECGIDAIQETAQMLGLGQRTGIDAEGERPGLTPGREWKLRVHKDGWRDGDTCNISIGQGALLVTPIQMAVVTAAIANGGAVYRPRLALGRRSAGSGYYHEEPPVLVRKLNWNPENLKLVRAGMLDVVAGENGTGRAARLPGVNVAGKTGTAEYGRKEEGRKHGWMIAFAPFEQPRYAVVILLEEIAASGGSEVGPRMRQLLGELLKAPGEQL